MPLSEFAFSMQMRDTIAKMVKERIDAERPRYRYGTVIGFNRTNFKCEVQLNGETGTVLVNMGSLQPAFVGQIVRVEGIGTDKFITDVLGESWNGVRYGTIEPIYTSGMPRVLWEGETTYSGPYPVEGGYVPRSGDTVIGVPSPGHGLTLMKAVNFTRDFPPPRWHRVTFQNSWGDYQGLWASGLERDWPTVAFTKTKSGIVKVRSIAARSGTPVNQETIFTLPEGFRPAMRMLVPAQSNGNPTNSAINVFPDGRVTWRAGSGSWMAFGNVQFPAADVAPDAAWTNFNLENSWLSWEDPPVAYPKPSWFRDADGVIWRRGLLKRAAAIASFTTFGTVASHATARNWHQRSLQYDNVFNLITKIAATGAHQSKLTTANQYVSIDGMPFIPADSPLMNKWVGIGYASGWSEYNTTYNQLGIVKTDGQHAYVTGLVKHTSGNVTMGSGTVICTLPEGWRPFRQDMFATLSYLDAPARVDVMEDGTIVTREGVNGNWVSLDMVNFITDGGTDGTAGPPK